MLEIAPWPRYTLIKPNVVALVAGSGHLSGGTWEQERQEDVLPQVCRPRSTRTGWAVFSFRHELSRPQNVARLFKHDSRCAQYLLFHMAVFSFRYLDIDFSIWSIFSICSCMSRYRLRKTLQNRAPRAHIVTGLADQQSVVPCCEIG